MANNIIREMGRIDNEDIKHYKCLKKIMALEIKTKIKTLAIIKEMGLKEKMNEYCQEIEREILHGNSLDAKLDLKRKNKERNYTG